MIRNLRERLNNELKSYHAVELSKQHLENTIQVSRIIYDKRRKMRKICTIEMIVNQFRFIAVPVYFLQGGVLLFLYMVISIAMHSEDFTSNLSALLSTSAILVSMTALPTYERSRRYHMIEIESTTRISCPQVILARICAIGIGDIICLIVLILLTFEKMNFPAQSILTFVLMPFLFCGIGCLFIQNHMNNEYSIYISTGFSIAVVITYWLIASKLQRFLLNVSIGFTIAVCGVLILILGIECRKLIMQKTSSVLQEAFI